MKTDVQPHSTSTIIQVFFLYLSKGIIPGLPVFEVVLALDIGQGYLPMHP